MKVCAVRCEWQLCFICNWLWSSYTHMASIKTIWHPSSLNKICNPLLTNIQNNLPLGIWSMSFNDILALYNLSKFISKCKLNNIQCKPIFYICKSRNKCCLDDWVIIKGKILHDWMHANPTNCLLTYSGIQLSKGCAFLQLCVLS